MQSISTEAKVGLFVLAGLIILAYMSFRVGEYGFGLRKGYLVKVTFDNVAGLEKDASVQIAGVEVGRVEGIGLKNGKASVTLRILPEVELEEDVEASIKTYGLLGDKYIDIVPGTRKKQFITEGEEITRVEKQADIDKLLRQLSLIAGDIKAVTGSLKTVIGGEEGVSNLRAILENTSQLTEALKTVMVGEEGESNLRTIMDNTRELTGSLKDIVQKNDEKFTIMITSLNNAALGMEKTFAALGEITEKVNRGEGTLGRMVADETVYDNLGKTLAALENITDKIDKGEGSIGKLINDEETVNNLNESLQTLDESLKSINRVVTKAEGFRTFLSYRGEYLFENSTAKNYLELKFQPKEDKFYILGLVADPRGKLTVTDTVVDGKTIHTKEFKKNELLFNAEIGKRYKEIVLRGGILESTGGAGLDYFAFNDKLKFTFEAFDFDEDRNPHLKAYAEYRLLNHVYLSGGWDDFISKDDSKSVFAGFSIRFEDDDLKYLLSSVPLP